MTERSSVMVSRTLYQISMLTLITSIFWVGMGIYQTTKSEIDLGVDKEILTPINSSIEIEVAEKWSQRDTQKAIQSVTIEEVQVATESSGSGDELVN